MKPNFITCCLFLSPVTFAAQESLLVENNDITLESINETYTSINIGENGTLTLDNSDINTSTNIILNGAIDSPAEMHVTNGSTVSNSPGFFLEVGNNSTLYMSEGSRVSVGQVNIKGELGQAARVHVSDGAVLTSRFGGLYVAAGNSEVPDYAILEINAGEVNSASGIYVGAEYGTGFVNITNGGKLNSFGSIGNAGGKGYVNISGEDSEWNAGVISIGDTEGSIGMLTISDGATVNAKNINTGDGVSQITIGGIGEAVSPGFLNVENIHLGSNNSSVIFNHTKDDYDVHTNIAGEGNIILKNGVTDFYGLNTISGITDIDNATFRAQNENVTSAYSEHHLEKTGILDLNGYNQETGEFYNAGTVYFNQRGEKAGTKLTVNGDYHGDGGTLVFNSVLGGDNSVTDSLYVIGGMSGNTNVKVNNLGGKGSQTVEGIKLITVDGEIAEGAGFQQAGRIVAGAYDYQLVQGDEGGNSHNWYLTSNTGGVDPVPPPVSPGPLPVDPVTPETNVTRPEAGSYIANLAATEMFIMRMENRGREQVYIDALTGEKKMTSMWLHSEGRHLNNSSGQLETRENRYVVQMGGDITGGSFTGKDNWRLGLMGGYGYSQNTTDSELSGYKSRGKVQGYSMGIYASWFENQDRRSGAWVDTWMQYAWFSNSVQGEDLARENYNSGGVQASAEAGYAFNVSASQDADYAIEPQAQLIWNGVKADEHQEANGTIVKSKGTDNIQLRLGIKGKADIRTSNGTNTDVKPFMAFNWIHNTHDYGVQMDDIAMTSSGAKDIAELKAGVEGHITPELSAWAGASVKMGTDNYRDTGGYIGIRYGF
ncbi:autotransporter outer membrane beta-barrel domain-containing protein [Enterobacter sp. 120016]|uniref:autotransporter outer membrane beta-barrel domain-containing protein n=1 Tax=Enterobacter sp. 120016 TaxID=2834878 RepID=UPI001BCD26D0|nr:autotransporter outer membrane beta-barrel domain-containing protein [Enterobacter sp. 120016]MBS7440986.1 autotransporter outer membrane beta-barrel domain-containing protein [Enterobacter sp. 120016]